MKRRIIFGIMIAALLMLPVVATETSTEEGGSSVETSDLEGVQDSGSSCSCSVDLSTIESNQDDIKQNQQTTNNNIAFLTMCLVSCSGLIVGYWTAKDLLSMLW